jgi:beta-galactosidase
MKIVIIVFIKCEFTKYIVFIGNWIGKLKRKLRNHSENELFMKSISGKGWKFTRFNVEIYPTFITLPIIAIYLYFIFQNEIYWGLVNEMINGFVSTNGIDYLSILIGVLITLAIIFLSLLFISFKRVDILHIPVINLIAPIIFFLLTVILIVLINVEERFSLDYLFFMLGPEIGRIIYLGIVIGVVLIVSIILIGLIQLNRMVSIQTDGPRTGHQLRPKLITITTLFNLINSMALFLMILFYYAPTDMYWENIFMGISRYLEGYSLYLTIWGIGAFILIIYQILAHLILKKQEDSRLTNDQIQNDQIQNDQIQNDQIQKDVRGIFKRFHLRQILFLSGIILTIVGIIGTSIGMQSLVTPYLPYLNIPLNFMQVFILIVLLFPESKNAGKKVYFWLNTKSNSQLIKYIKPKTIKRIAIIALLVIPYWFSFIHPLLARTPQVDFSSQTHLKTLNGISVPFQGETVYSNFETQSDFSHEYLNLSGEWKFFKEGGSNKFSMSPRTDYILQDLSKGREAADFDDSSWEIIDVPHSFPLVGDSNPYYGAVWYRRTIDVPAEFLEKVILLKCLGINYICDIWIDGNYIGYHENGFTSFNFDVSSALSVGSHVLAIRVDNPTWDGYFNNRMMPEDSDFFNYGGIVRELYLEAYENISIMRVDVRQKEMTTINHLEGTQNIDLDIVMHTMKNHGEILTGDIDIAIYPLNFSSAESLKSRETWKFIDGGSILTPFHEIVSLNDVQDTGYTTVSYSLSLSSVNFWSTKRPNLYCIQVNLTYDGITDVFHTQTGFRNFTTMGTELRLNGAPFKLAGMSVHEQYPDPVGRSLTDDHRINDLLLLNESRSNWWRGSYPFHPMMYIFSDRLGLACWEEGLAFWLNENDFYLANSRDFFRSMWIEILYRDLNRPSILIWGACNEPWAQEALYNYLDESRSFLKENDPTRIMSYASVSSHYWAKGFDNLELLTPNTYGGTFDGLRGDWYGELTKQAKIWTDKYPQKPMISMEWGFWRTGDHSDQIACFTEGFRAFTENPNVQGFTWWLAFDYIGGANGEPYYNSMGIFNHERTWASPTLSYMIANYTTFTAVNL